MLAEVLAEAGRLGEAAGAIDEAVDVAEETGEHFYKAEIHRARGDVLARRDVDGAERVTPAPPPSPAAAAPRLHAAGGHGRGRPPPGGGPPR
jgi:predicted ATPase